MTGATEGVGAGTTLTTGEATTAGGTLEGCDRPTAAGGRNVTGFGGALAGTEGRDDTGFAAALGDTEGRTGFGGALESTEGRVFGGALDSCGDPQRAGFGRALDRAGSPEGAGFGVALDRTGRPESVARLGGTLDGVGFGATLVRARGGIDAVFGGTLDSAGWRGALDKVGGGRDDAGLEIPPSIVAFPTGTVVLTATFTGTLSDSGMSSQPESISSPAGMSRFSASCEP
jgi:hypothetical protein